MYLYRHDTARNVIDLDDLTGLWMPVPESDGDPIFVGSMCITLRADFQVRGSYTIENEKRCCFYWTDDGELVFRTPDKRRFSLFRREHDGKLIDLMPQLAVDLQPSTHGDGRAIPNMSIFRLVDTDGSNLFEISYDSERYLQYYLGNFTFVPDEDLSDWDFFIAVKRAVEELKIIARSCALISKDSPKTAAAEADLVIAETGTASPLAGLWVACNNLNIRCRLSMGENIPEIDGQHEKWVWVGV